MFSTLLIKEIQETLNNNRSLISAILCLVLIPLGIYVSALEYEKRLETYRAAEKTYHENAEGRLHNDFGAEGYRPPSSFSIFSKGLEDVMPEKVITHKSGIYSFHKEWGINNPVSTILGNIDFLFITAFILSLLALINTFSSISGEKDTGTLKLVVSNPVNRWKIILAKMMGPYLVFAVFFILSVIISLLLLMILTNINMQGSRFWTTVFALVFLSLIYLMIMFSLGTFISGLTNNSVSSIVILLFIWVLFFAIIPKTSPLLAQIIYPVPSQKTINDEKQLARQNLENELNSIRKEKLETMLKEQRIDYRDLNFQSMEEPEVKTVFNHYSEEIAGIEKEYQEKIYNTLHKIDLELALKRRKQENIGKFISRISPVSSYVYLITELSATGIMELDNFNKHARYFQEKVQKQVYHKFELKRYMFGGSTWDIGGAKSGVDQDKIPVPHLDNFRNTPFIKILLHNISDLLMLLFYLIAIPLLSFYVFDKYDVR